MASPFLQMPGEIRNRIYEYALTESEGLQYRENVIDDGHHEVHVGTLCLFDQEMEMEGFGRVVYADANQLRFVSRQIHRETKGLSFHLNDITFSGSDEKELQTCVNFLTGMLPANFVHVHKITLFSEWDAREWFARWNKFAVFAAFCKKYPALKINIRFHDLRQNTDRFYIELVLLTVLHKGDNNKYMQALRMNDPYLSGQVGLAASAIRFVDSLKQRRLAPDNFRMFPGLDVFREHDFREFCKSSKDPICCRIARLEGALDNWTEVVRDIFENGI